MTTAGRIGDIELLRGLAVLGILVHHSQGGLLAWSTPALERFHAYFNLGHTLDLFFAISGFVIARDLMPRVQDSSNDRESFFRLAIGFWILRAYRLLPSAWICLAGIVLLSLLFNQSNAFGSFRSNFAGAIAAMLQVANMHYAINAFSELGMGVTYHFWSLSLEEQIDLALPFMLLLRGESLSVAGRDARAGAAPVGASRGRTGALRLDVPQRCAVSRRAAGVVEPGRGLLPVRTGIPPRPRLSEMVHADFPVRRAGDRRVGCAAHRRISPQHRGGARGADRLRRFLRSRLPDGPGGHQELLHVTGLALVLGIPAAPAGLLAGARAGIPLCAVPWHGIRRKPHLAVRRCSRAAAARGERVQFPLCRGSVASPRHGRSTALDGIGVRRRSGYNAAHLFNGEAAC